MQYMEKEMFNEKHRELLLTCERCGYIWLPRSLTKKPKVCANCNSRKWNIPREEK